MDAGQVRQYALETAEAALLDYIAGGDWQAAPGRRITAEEKDVRPLMDTADDTAVEAWPFGADADRDDPLTALRIAVASPRAGWAFIVTFDRESEARPTDAEAAMLASFLDAYKSYWYNASYRATPERRPLDVDGSANGVTFRKYGPDDWAYRRRSWQFGPVFLPAWPSLRAAEIGADPKPLGPLTLEAVMDHMHTYGGTKPTGRWLTWKAEHPDVFPPVAV